MRKVDIEQEPGHMDKLIDLGKPLRTQIPKRPLDISSCHSESHTACDVRDGVSIHIYAN